MLNSITKILDNLPFSVMARKEVFAHPNVDSELAGYNGTFHDALAAGKTISTYTENEQHAVTLFDIDAVFRWGLNSLQSDIFLQT